MRKINLLPLAALAVFCSVLGAFAQSEPEIMSYKEYGKIRHKRPYILEFKTDKGALVYFGAGHFYSYTDAQAAEIEKRFAEFKPTVVLNESGTPPVAATAKEAVEKYGEPGLLSFLAKKYNVPIKSLDPPRMEEMKYILGTKRWTLEQVFLFYVLRRVPENNKKTNPKNPEELVQEALNVSAKTPGFESLPKTIAEFDAVMKKNLPQIADWRKIDQKIFDPNPDLGNFTNDIADASVNFRGRFMVKTLAAEVEKGERVFAAVGASHVVKQEKALNNIFGKTTSARND
ncbi:MAG: TraB/GumN family protein [Acidobacteriota bacterium]|nr:TraB/GumN family protein [Acidobacteriota bacterium]